MRRIIIFFSMVVASLTVVSCYYDEVMGDSDELPQNVSFNRDVMAIFNKSCNMAGCHDADPPQLPSLVQENAYNSLVQGGFVNTTVPSESTLYAVLAEGNMPPSGALSSREMKIILAWLNEGALNN
ncbi:MAG TPA: hypothetical protein VFO54_09045 [Chryseosolibacter sp.]|nr:hypothetical protein [Chryseosolibacter sp.]